MKLKLLLLTCMSLFSIMLFSQNSLFLDVGYQLETAGVGNRDGFAGGQYDGEVRKVIEQPDGKLIVLGSFNTYNGKPAGGIARLLPNGEMDPSFAHSVGFNSTSFYEVYGGYLQSDGKIVVIGSMQTFNSANILRGICRLNSDGTLDQTFAANGSAGANYSNHVFSSKITAIARLSNGNYVVGGTFNSLFGTNNEALALAIIDGTTGVFVRGVTAAASATINTASQPVISSIEVDGSDNIYVGGNFHYIANGLDFKHVAKFNNLLVLDQTYTYNTATSSVVSPNSAVTKIKLTSGNKLIIFGDFTTVNATGTANNYNITRLDANGIVDPTFVTRTAKYQLTGQNDSSVKDFDIDANGKIVALVTSRNSVSGYYNYRPVFYIHDSNGNVESTLPLETTISFNNYNFCLLSNGKIVMGGNFASIGSITAGRIVKTGATYGDLDLTFNQAKGFNGTIEVVLRDGADTYVAGKFTSFDGTIGAKILKFNAQGDLVSTYYPSTTHRVTAMTKVENGIMVALFDGSKPVFNFINLTDGAQLIAPNIASSNGGEVKSMVYVAVNGTSGKLYVGGSFSSIGGKSYFMRVNVTKTVAGVVTAIATDGGYASQYYPIFNGPIETMKVNGQMYVMGSFTSININGVAQAYNGVCRVENLSGNGNVDGWLKGGGIFGSGFKANDCEFITNNILVVGKFTSAKSVSAGATVNLNNIVSFSTNNLGYTVNSYNYANKLSTVDEVYKVAKINDTLFILSLASQNGYAGNTNCKSMAFIKFNGDLHTTMANSFGTQLSDSRVYSFTNYNASTKDIFAVGSFNNMFGQERARMAKIIFGLNAPQAASTQEFCSASNPTLANIAYSQVPNVKYFTAATGGTELPVTTTLVDGTTYYLAAVNGAEVSVARTPVTVNLVSQYERTDVVSACGSYTWINGVVYTQSTVAGSYPSFVYAQSPDGCDSIAYLNLTIKPVSYKTINAEVCGSTYNVTGSSLVFTSTSTSPISTQSFNDTLVAMNGCDSIVTYNITFKLPSVNEMTISACDSYQWSHTGLNYTQSGVYRDTIANYLGCDSILVLNLTINASSQVTINQTACGSYTWVVGTETRNYTASTQDQITLTRLNGCDSVITLNLTINQPTPGITSNLITECSSFTIPNSGGITYSSPGTYIDTLVLENIAGCDSLVRWETIILPIDTRTITVESCGTYYWNLTGQTYTTSNTYSANVPHQNPDLCDSVITLHLTINAIPSNAITFSNGVLTATETGASYQWIDCATDQPIAGATNRTFTLTENGSYAVEITKNGCSSLSDCETVNNLSLQSLDMSGIRVFPNPTSGLVSVSLPETFANVTIEIVDVAGKLIRSIALNQENNVTFSIVGEPGVYNLKITSTEGVVMKKVIVQ